MKRRIAAGLVAFVLICIGLTVLVSRVEASKVEAEKRAAAERVLEEKRSEEIEMTRLAAEKEVRDKARQQALSSVQFSIAAHNALPLVT